MKATHGPATTLRPLRGRQRFLLVAVGVVGAIVIGTIGLLIMLTHWTR